MGALTRCLGASLCPSFGVQALEVVLVVVDKGHGTGKGPVAGLLGDEAVHLLGHPAVTGVALGA